MKFITNRIPTGSKSSFSDLVQKIASASKTVKTASTAVEPEAKVAEKTEPANGDNEMRHDVHGPEGSPSDQNGEPEQDGEHKVVSAQAVAQPVSKPVPTPARPAAKPAPVAQKPAAPAVPAAKPPLAVKPAVPGAARPTAPAAPMAAKPATTGAAPTMGQPPAPVAPITPAQAAKPIAPAAPSAPSASVAQKPAAPSAPSAKTAPKNPALASATEEVVVAANADCGCATKVAEGQAEQDNGSEGETKNTGKFPEPDREQMYKQEPQEDGKAETAKEASAPKSDKFTRIANLTPKAKNWLKKYWSIVYPSDYADAMTQDK